MATVGQHDAGAGEPPPARAHVIVPTHTTRHLALCLASLARQQTPPATIVVTVDGEVPEIEAEARALLDRLDPARRPKLAITTRPHTGIARLNQVRNNGLRALDTLGLADEDLIIILDGDTMLAADAVGRHLDFAARSADVIVPFRVNLSEEATRRLALDEVLDERFDPGALATDADRRALAARHRRYRRQFALKRIPGLVKPHKPKVLGGHHAVRADALRAVNGYDEQYTGYGFDDDDLARRLHRLRPRPRVAIAARDIIAVHLWHPSRAPARPEQAPGAARFARRDLPVRAEQGWDRPSPQEPGKLTTL